MDNKTKTEDSPTKIVGIKSLIDDLKIVYEGVRNKEIQLTDAKEVANLAGKLIKASSLKIEYNKYLNSAEKIDFLE